jgi:hypothetical protein
MASSASNLSLLVQSQSGKEATANALWNAMSQAALFARYSSSGLIWFYYGGTIIVDGVVTQIANNTTTGITLSASTTNYIEADRSGTVTKNTTGFTPGRIPLYTAVTNATTITSYTDCRGQWQPLHIPSKTSVAVTAADVTLTQAQAACRYLTTTGILTGNRNVIVPNEWEGIVYCNNTGAFTTTFKTSAGTGVVVAQTKRAILLADGTNVVRITADA